MATTKKIMLISLKELVVRVKDYYAKIYHSAELKRVMTTGPQVPLDRNFLKILGYGLNGLSLTDLTIVAKPWAESEIDKSDRDGNPIDGIVVDHDGTQQLVAQVRPQHPNDSVDRSHEECGDCLLRKCDPPQCLGHAQGPVHCGSFVEVEKEV